MYDVLVSAVVDYVNTRIQARGGGRPPTRHDPQNNGDDVAAAKAGPSSSPAQAADEAVAAGSQPPSLNSSSATVNSETMGPATPPDRREGEGKGDVSPIAVVGQGQHVVRRYS